MRSSERFKASTASKGLNSEFEQAFLTGLKWRWQEQLWVYVVSSVSRNRYRIKRHCVLGLRKM